MSEKDSYIWRADSSSTCTCYLLSQTCHQITLSIITFINNASSLEYTVKGRFTLHMSTCYRAAWCLSGYWCLLYMATPSRISLLSLDLINVPLDHMLDLIAYSYQCIVRLRSLSLVLTCSLWMRSSYHVFNLITYVVYGMVGSTPKLPLSSILD